MGWAKYTEDNYEILLERQALKGGSNRESIYNFQNATTTKVKLKEESNFAETLLGQSCFSS